MLVNPFRDLVLSPNRFDLISALYALPFYGPKGFGDFIAELVSSLKTGGVFVGQFFGEGDGWNTPDSKLVFQTKDDAEALLKDLDVKEFVEEEKDGTTAAGEAKHWHVFHFIATKP